MVVARPYEASGDENLKQPPSLTVLFFTELWERFSFYGMRALLVLYMTNELLFHDSKAYGIYGAYMALAYAMPIIGGLVSDRLIGNRRAIFLGGTLMAIGHFVLAIPSLDAFYLGLGLIISGNGFFKANISSLLGEFYKKRDPRRDAGFTLFYMGVNVGAFLSPLLCGYLGEVYGWHYGFGLAGVGMFVGLIIFWCGQSTLGDKGKAPDEKKLKEKWAGISLGNLAYILAFMAVPFLVIGVYNYPAMEYFMPIAGVATIVWLLTSALRLNSGERANVLVFLAMSLFYMTFFAFFEQAGSSLNLFTDRNVDRMVILPFTLDFEAGIFSWSSAAFEIPTPWFQSLNPFFIVLFGPLFSWLWKNMGKRGCEPQTPVKFFFALLQLGFGFIVLSWSVGFANSAALTPILWISLSYLFQTTGELCLSPIALSMTTKLAPRHMKSALMGALMFSLAFAHYIAALIAQLMSVPSTDDGQVDAVASLPVYTDIFGQIGYVSIGISVIALLCAPLFKGMFSKVEGRGA
ncbi:MAG: peptide MFS transporter [bacterium]|nr:peptide MFS transporter [bacterium]